MAEPAGSEGSLPPLVLISLGKECDFLISSLRKWSKNRGVLSPGCHQKSVVRVVFHQMVCHQGGLSSDGLSSGWTFIRWSVIRVVRHCLVFHQMVCHHGSLSLDSLSGWSFLRWYVVRVACH